MKKIKVLVDILIDDKRLKAGDIINKQGLDYTSGNVTIRKNWMEIYLRKYPEYFKEFVIDVNKDDIYVSLNNEFNDGISIYVGTDVVKNFDKKELQELLANYFNSK